MAKLLFATGNAHKLTEAREILADFELLSPADFPQLGDLDPEETGNTFAENAQIKARAFADLTGVPTIAEDAGLVVAALNGEPGVHSNRWLEGSDEDRCLAILKRLTGVVDRRAKFIAVVCFYDPNSQELKHFQGEITGEIGLRPAGSNGFGYDPIFIPEGHTQSFASLDSSVKRTISHRQQALDQFKSWFKDQ